MVNTINNSPSPVRENAVPDTAHGFEIEVEGKKLNPVKIHEDLNRQEKELRILLSGEISTNERMNLNTLLDKTVEYKKAINTVLHDILESPDLDLYSNEGELKASG